MKIALIGSTGLVGSHLLERLLVEHEITTISRRSNNIKHQNLSEIIQPELNSDSLSNIELPEQDIFICALGTTIKQAGSQAAFRAVDQDLVNAFAKLALKSTPKAFFIISAMGANADSKIFYNRVKGEVEDHLKTLPFESLYILRPALLIGDRPSKRFGEQIGINLFKTLNPLLPDRFSKLIGTDIEKIGDYILGQLNHLKSGVQIIPSNKIQ